MLNADQSFIEPTTKDARVVAEWLDGQNPRGFFTEGALVVFNGYGNAHDSMRRFFKLASVDDCFIIQKNGDVSLEWTDRKEALDRIFSGSALAFFKAVAKLRGNSSPCVRPME